MTTPEPTREPETPPAAPPSGEQSGKQSVPKVRPAVAAAGRKVAEGGRTAMGAARRPQGRLIAGGLFVTAIVTAVVLVAVWLAPSGGVPTAQESSASAGPTSAAPSSTGEASFSPTPTTSSSPLPPNSGLTEWADKLAVKVEIPPVALRAYAYAEYVLTNRKPACNLHWTTIAAIGKIETNHGRVGASTLGPDGRVLPPIVGPALDGKAGRAKVTDTDAGALDNDRAWDHSVGPLQFLPAAWRTFAVDADGDGIVDPNDIDDAALATATKLCEANKDLSQAANWNAAIKTFPDLSAKVQQVFDAANTYGQKSRT
ncbi:MAG: murein transglycosylase [Hamadaea sp.]|uniref:lytic murein transglycosylase n=1 Tax=Hamadaea sp. TaxID=2024425 RepID=UPI001803D239|nr:lytic murein transglycosylase [Hamadaea sp.]NUR72414.1 murein transglycosylase [Hamadaea sp.]NUT19231.1 murein transglycosylase [Hamadaea sp.]